MYSMYCSSLYTIYDFVSFDVWLFRHPLQPYDVCFQDDDQQKAVGKQTGREPVAAAAGLGAPDPGSAIRHQRRLPP